MSEVTSPNVSDAKARAEARRKRILEASKTRLNVVSGLEPKKNDEGEVEGMEESHTAEDHEQEPFAAGSVGGEGKEENDQAAEHLSSAQKLAQLRRRRYGQKLNQANEKLDSTTEEKLEGESVNEHVPVSQNKTDTTLETMLTTQPQVECEDNENEEEAEADRNSTTTATTTFTTDQEPKKYLGVAKMRRMKIAEKKAAEEAAAAADLSSISATSPSTADSSHIITPEIKARILASRKAVPKLPALVQLLTVIALFLSGLDVGIQNHILWKQDVPYLHENLSYYDHGVGAWKNMMMPSSQKNNNKNKKKKQQETLSDKFLVSDNIVIPSDPEDEFESSDPSQVHPKPAGASKTTTAASNLDPVFGVNFDALTAGSGFFFACARFAVSVHRAFYHYFFAMPKSIVLSILSIPKKMMVHPPIMFLCAILIRYVGKHLLGGNIPDIKDIVEADENLDRVHAASTGTGAASDNKMGGAVDKLVSTNFMAMGGDYVKNYVKDHFPKATLAFTVFKDARNDMLIVLCGFFVGLVLPMSSEMGAKRIRDEF